MKQVSTVPKVGSCNLCKSYRKSLADALKGNSSIYTPEEACHRIRTCKECGLHFYALYRRVTGECETCGQIMSEHCRCVLCGILLGEGHESQDTLKKQGEYWCGFCHPGRRK